MIDRSEKKELKKQQKRLAKIQANKNTKSTLPELEKIPLDGIGILAVDEEQMSRRLPGWQLKNFISWALRQRSQPDGATFVGSGGNRSRHFLKVGAPAYQIEALIKGCISMPCLKTGRQLESRHGVPYGGSIGYRFFSDGQTYILFAAGFSTGFSLVGVWLVEKQLIICLPPASREKKVIKAFIGFSKTIADCQGDYIAYVHSQRDNTPALYLRTPPFPHHIWNELPGVEIVATHKNTSPDIPIMVLAQPVAPISDLFPEIAANVKVLKEGKVLKFLNSHSHFPVRIGSKRIPKELIKRLAQYSSNNMSVETRAVAEKLDQSLIPVLGVTIRVHNRRWLSEENGLRSLFEALRNKGLHFSIVVLGFSIQNEDDSEQDEAIKKLLALEVQRAEKITEGHPPDLVHYIIGARLTDSFAIAEHIDFYIANHGTIQHRLGWFGNAAGLIHANKKTIEDGKGFFATFQARENAPPAKYIDSSAVQDLSRHGKAGGKRTNLHDYDFDWRIMLDDVEKGIRGVGKPACII